MADEAKISYIKRKLYEDLSSVDLQWSLLNAALSSYRHDSVLKPFPPMFTSEGSEHKDYAGLEKTMTKCPSLVRLKKYLKHCDENQKAPSLDSKLVDLLHWLIQHSTYQLRTCDSEKYSLITELTGQVVPVATPTHVFELKYSDASNEKFQQRRGVRDVIHAIHGSRVENFHGILNHGLQVHLCKVGLFGEGIYLSSELSVSMPYAPTGTGWENSSLGDRLSCFAVCEIIDDENYVKCSEKDPVNNSSSSNTSSSSKPMSKSSSRNLIAGSEGGKVPEKYYVVQNNDMLRVKYIILYAEKSKSKLSSLTWTHWLKEHKFVIMLCFYALILTCVGLYSSPTAAYYSNYVRRYLRQR